MRSARDRAPRTGVGARLARQAEHPLADDVALHLVGPTGDAIAGSPEQVLVPLVRAPLPGVGQQARPEDADRNCLILVDQFEELFRFALSRGNEDEAAEFVRILLDVVEQREFPVFVATTMRSDFLGDCDQFRGLPEALNRSQYLVPRLTRQQLQALVLIQDFGDGTSSHGVHDDLPLSPELGPSVSRVAAKVPTDRRRESTDANVDARRP